jgi:hypothetical protein
MKIQTTILREHPAIEGFHLFWLVTQFISLHKRVTNGHDPKATNEGMRRLATKKSSYTIASSSSGSGTVSALGSQALPSAKYPFSVISLILPWVMVDAPK